MATVATAAAAKSVMVVDISDSVPFCGILYFKFGVSFVVDFRDGIGVYCYGHFGVGVGLSAGISYSVGLVENLTDPSKYSGVFVDLNFGNYYGIGHCFAPLKPNTPIVSATSATFGVGSNCGLGIDVYSVPFVLFKQGKR